MSSIAVVAGAASAQVGTQPGGGGQPGVPPPQGAWRWGMLMVAPHRLGFFLAMVVLSAASGWWLAVQFDRVTGWLGLVESVPALLVHAVVMVFGFVPLFFSGFLFTAGPRWLDVAPHAVVRTAPCVLMQAAGWLLWLAGAHGYAVLAWAGLGLAWVGLAWMVVLFWRLVWASRALERVHALTAGFAGVAGVLCLAGVALAWLWEETAWALLWARSGLWAFVVVTYAVVAHRMIPFFTANVLPMVRAWRPLWVLWLMCGVCLWQVADVWVRALWGDGLWWAALGMVLEAVAGGVLLWLAVAWGLVQSLKVRLLAMLHVGFVWLGLALVYGAVSRGMEVIYGVSVLGLGPLHVLALGFMGSLMLAMVTRVSCGHSGRPLVAGNGVWALFGLLQVVVLVRALAAVQGVPVWLMLVAAGGWVAVVWPWCGMCMSWYGRPRVDGKPG